MGRSVRSFSTAVAVLAVVVYIFAVGFLLPYVSTRVTSLDEGCPGRAMLEAAFGASSRNSSNLSPRRRAAAAQATGSCDAISVSSLPSRRPPAPAIPMSRQIELLQSMKA